MNEKAFVTKDLHDKHTKILEGLLKLPENRHCADCQSNGPRWASVNLGVFICLQCSGIHRSLGVHISKVRSTTLDTWLPEQVAFMQCMGNKRSNMHWEAELPPDYDRSGTEKFIHAKYEEKRWVAKDAAQPSPECIDMCHLSNEHVEGGSKNQIPKKLRNFSLEEKILSTHTVQVGPPPPVKQRGCSLDMNDITLSSAEPTESLPTSELDTSAKKDLFSLLYSRPPQQHRPSRHPTNWATFDYREGGERVLTFKFESNLTLSARINIAYGIRQFCLFTWKSKGYQYSEQTFRGKGGIFCCLSVVS